MLPEAIAIVMAPKFNQTGFFVLTPNYGLDFIGSCRSDKSYLAKFNLIRNVALHRTSLLSQTE
jgi:hypothetical protein